MTTISFEVGREDGVFDCPTEGREIALQRQQQSNVPGLILHYLRQQLQAVREICRCWVM